jgi:phage-related protein
MANEIELKLGTFQLDSGQTYAISSIDFSETKNVITHNIPKTDGAIAEEGMRGALTISIKGTIANTNYDALRSSIDDLKESFHAGIQKFTIDDDRYIMAQLKSFKKSFITLRTIAEFDATFVAHYPFWLGEDEITDDRTPESAGAYPIINLGNAPARCKIEITAPSGGIDDAIQIDNQTNGTYFQYHGTVATLDVFKVDNRYETDDFTITNDGVDDTANYAGDFIELEPGYNIIVYTGTAGATVKFSFRYTWY